MTESEYRAALDKMTEPEFSKFKTEFGGEGTRDRYVSEFAHDPKHERRLSQLLGRPTEAEKMTKAAVESARAATESAEHARLANRISVAALIAALLAAGAAFIALLK